MIELLAEAAGIGCADLTLHLATVAGVFELDDSLAVRLGTEHIVVLILSNHSVTVEFDILLMHLVATYALNILTSRRNLTALHRAHKLLESRLLGDERRQMVSHALEAESVSAHKADGALLAFLLVLQRADRT